MTEKAILFDSSICTACRSCQTACKRWNELEAEVTHCFGSYENPPSLSDRTWLKLGFTDAVINGKVKWLYTFTTCLHCTEANCINVCQYDAIVRTDEGFVHIDQQNCTGCGECVSACPFDVPHLDEKSGKAVKCDGCSSVGRNRITTEDSTKPGWVDKPACVMGCAPEALKYGDLDTLLAEGKARVSQLKSAGYSNACLYGETELGGLHVLSVLEDSPSVYGLPESPKVVTAGISGDWLEGAVGQIFAPVGLASLAFGAFCKRKEKIGAEQEPKA